MGSPLPALRRLVFEQYANASVLQPSSHHQPLKEELPLLRQMVCDVRPVLEEARARSATLRRAIDEGLAAQIRCKHLLELIEDLTQCEVLCAVLESLLDDLLQAEDTLCARVRAHGRLPARLCMDRAAQRALPVSC